MEPYFYSPTRPHDFTDNTNFVLFPNIFFKFTVQKSGICYCQLLDCARSRPVATDRQLCPHLANRLRRRHSMVATLQISRTYCEWLDTIQTLPSKPKFSNTCPILTHLLRHIILPSTSRSVQFPPYSEPKALCDVAIFYGSTTCPISATVFPLWAATSVSISNRQSGNVRKRSVVNNSESLVLEATATW